MANSDAETWATNCERKRILTENIPDSGNKRSQRFRLEVTVGQVSRKRERRNLSVRSTKGSYLSGVSPAGSPWQLQAGTSRTGCRVVRKQRK